MKCLPHQQQKCAYAEKRLDCGLSGLYNFVVHVAAGHFDRLQRLPVDELVFGDVDRESGSAPRSIRFPPAVAAEAHIQGISVLKIEHALVHSARRWLGNKLPCQGRRRQNRSRSQTSSRPPIKRSTDNTAQTNCVITLINFWHLGRTKIVTVSTYLYLYSWTPK